MSRSRNSTRLSRGLIVVLTALVALGAVVYLHNASQSNASQSNASKASSISSATELKSKKKAKVVDVSNDSTTKPTDAASTLLLASNVSVSSAPDTANNLVVSPATQPSAGSPSTQPTAILAASTIKLSATPLVDAKAKADAGDLLGARQIYNAALLAGQLSDADATAAKAAMATINQTVVFSPKIFADDEYGGTYSVQPGEMLQKIAVQHQVTWQYLCRVNNLSDPKRLRAGATIKVIKGPFSALVDKKKFTMELWLGGEPYSADSMYITTFPVGLGKDDSTPDGKWMIQQGNKVKDPVYYSPRGEGVIPADDPKNPLGKFWMGLVGVDGHAVGKTSYGIHGTIDPDSIGKQESMGCIRMRNEDVAIVFELLVDGKSPVIVKG